MRLTPMSSDESDKEYFSDQDMHDFHIQLVKAFAANNKEDIDKYIRLLQGCKLEESPLYAVKGYLRENVDDAWEKAVPLDGYIGPGTTENNLLYLYLQDYVYAYAHSGDILTAITMFLKFAKTHDPCTSLGLLRPIRYGAEDSGRTDAFKRNLYTVREFYTSCGLLKEFENTLVDDIEDV